MTAVRNALFIMCDQLRWDYLSCYGHPTLETPNIDRLAARGVRFDSAFVQGPVCGSSRMSYYTGRYVTSHGAIWNFVPLPVHHWTLGDFLRPHGIRCGVAGKTHVTPDRATMQLLAIDPATREGVFLAQGGFEPLARDDGTWPQPKVEDASSPYARYLRELGYVADNPWHDFANSALAEDGSILSGWDMRNAGLPANIRPEHSESAYVTDRAIDFVREQGERPWCLHLSYIKPHWPYVAPAPYHDMYTAEDVASVKQHADERSDPHPVVEAYRSFMPSVTFSRKEVRDTVIPTYMGLIKEVDDHIGRLITMLDAAGRLEDTLIVFCSDHGDYLGDHWLGDKELFHDVSAKTPMIVVDPGTRADGTRGTTESRLVEAIDVVPTILDALGLPVPAHILEGRSLVPLIDGTAKTWRHAVFSEANYAFRDIVRAPLGRPLSGCHCYMVRTATWKYNYYEGFRAELFDLAGDPDEFHDLGTDPAYAAVAVEMQTLLFDWLRGRRIHPSISFETIAQFNKNEQRIGIKIGAW